MRKYSFLILLLAVIMLIDSAKVEPSEKLYNSIFCNNLQGLKEVLAEESDIDFQNMNLNRHDFTAFRKNDLRALALALDGWTDETIILELLSSGKVDASGDGDDITYLEYAICDGTLSLEIAEALIDNGADINDAGKETCLESFLELVYPEMYDKEERIEFLVEHGATVDEGLLSAVLKNEYKYLYAADVIKLLRKENAAISDSKKCIVAAATGDEKTLLKIASEEADRIGTTELLLASGTCSVKTLRKLEETGYDFNIKDKENWTPLHVAALNNHKEAVQFFIDKGFDVNVKTSFIEQKPIDMAAIGANLETLEYLLEHGGDTENLWTSACSEGTGAAMEYLLKKGYEPTQYEIYCALVESSDVIFKKIIEKGFPINGANDEDIPIDWVDTEERMITLLEEGVAFTGETLCHAVELRAYNAIDIMLKNGENVAQGEALIEAVKLGDMRILKKLVDNGADINQLVDTEDGKEAAVHTASWSVSREILEYLIDHGADIKMKDGSGKTPYEIAKEAKNYENMEILNEKNNKKNPYM